MSRRLKEQGLTFDTEGAAVKGKVWRKPAAALLAAAVLAAAAGILLVTPESVAAIQGLILQQGAPDLSGEAGLGLIFAVGVLSSFHCAGMCGGIAAAQSVRLPAGQEDSVGRRLPFARYIPSLLYNGGRVTAYTVIGGLAGGLGHTVQLAGIWRGMVPLAGGVFMVIMAMNLLGIWKVLRRLNLAMPPFAARKLMAGASRLGPYSVGLLSGLMPCGPLQMMQLYALGTASVWYGALTMLVFSLGTVPMLVLAATLHTALSRSFSSVMTKAGAVLILVLGIVMASRGLALTGISVIPSTKAVSGMQGTAAVREADGQVQTVSTRIGKSSYPSIVVHKGVPVRWTVHADAADLNSCNETMVLPDFHMEKKLAAGDNIILFTPEKEGRFLFTCWMGMITGTITVVE